MKIKINLTKEWFVKWIKQNYLFLLVNLFFAILVYFLMFSNQLMNDLDGIWHTSNFIAGDWEISLGRGLQRYMDKMRFGIISVPLNSVITLILIILSNIFLLDVLDIKNQAARYLFSFYVIACPLVCCSLSYSYMSPNFGAAYLFAVLAVVAAQNGSKIWKIPLTALGIGISMAFYQAYFGCTCLLLLLLCIGDLLTDIKVKDFLKKVGAYLLAVVLGGVMYYVITYLLLWRAGVSLASYGGASRISPLSVLTSMPGSIRNCYVSFLTFFGAQNLNYMNSLGSILVIIGAMILLVTLVLLSVRQIRSKRVLNGILLVVAVLLLPIFANAIQIIAVGNSITTLMGMGMVISPVIILQLLKGEEEVKWKKVGMVAATLVFVCLVWVSVSTVNNDQLALKEGKTSTVTLTKRMLNALDEQGYFSKNVYAPIAFVGRPAENETFLHNTAYETANSYARFGSWSTDARNNRYSWLGVLNEYCGVTVNVCSEDQYKDILNLKEVVEMPNFPAEGSIAEYDGVIVVKVSSLY